MSLSNGKPNRSYVSIRQQLEDWQHMAKEAACAAERVIADITAERDAAIARVEAAEAQVKRLRAALGEYATDANWRLGQRFDPNSPNFEGTLVARAALAPDDSTFTRAALEPAHD